MKVATRFFHTVNEQMTNKESEPVTIVPYEPRYQSAFKFLNEEWISTYWEMEEIDYQVLDHPQEHILDQGGFILVALFHDEPVGVCALRRSEYSGYDYELTKLAVSPRVQGRKIGVKLCEAVIAKAIEMGSKKIFLESNTVLKPAIALYRKLGFREVVLPHAAYERVNIQMELNV